VSKVWRICKRWSK